MVTRRDLLGAGGLILIVARAPIGRANQVASSLPNWRTAMADNSRINLSLNTLASVDPANDPRVNPNYPGREPWRGAGGQANGFGYSQCAVAPALGQRGSLVMTLSGHNGNWGNHVLRFDVNSRRFSRMSNPYPGPFFQDKFRQHSDPDNAELYVSSELKTDETQPSAFQSYGTLVVLPPGVGGTGSAGALVTPLRSACTPAGNVTGSSVGKRAHKFELNQSDRATAKWVRFTSNITSGVGVINLTGWTALDLAHNKIFVGAAHSFSNQLRVIDVVTRQWASTMTLTSRGNIQGAGAGVIFMHQYAQAWHWVANPDYLIMFRGVGDLVTGRCMLVLINVATGECFAPGTTGPTPAFDGGGDWVESAQKLVFYEGGTADPSGKAGDPNRVFLMTPSSTSDPAVFTTTPWTLSTVKVTGPAPGVQLANIPHGGRFRWVESVKSCLWWPNGVDPIQAWRIAGLSDV